MRDGEQRCASPRRCDAQFGATLREWDVSALPTKVKERPDWNTSIARPHKSAQGFEGRGDKGQDGRVVGTSCDPTGRHEVSSNDAAGWRTAHPTPVHKHFEGSLRAWPGGVDLDGTGRRLEANYGIARKLSFDPEKLTTARCDGCFYGSLRDYRSDGGGTADSDDDDECGPPFVTPGPRALPGPRMPWLTTRDIC